MSSVTLAGQNRSRHDGDVIVHVPEKNTSDEPGVSSDRRDDSRVVTPHRPLTVRQFHRAECHGESSYEIDDDSVVKLRGCSHLRDLSTGHFTRKDEIRTKVISITSGTHILYELPYDAPVDSMQIRSVGGKGELQGHGGFRMDLTEYSVHHP